MKHRPCFTAPGGTSPTGALETELALHHLGGVHACQGLPAAAATPALLTVGTSRLCSSTHHSCLWEARPMQDCDDLCNDVQLYARGQPGTAWTRGGRHVAAGPGTPPVPMLECGMRSSGEDGAAHSYQHTPLLKGAHSGLQRVRGTL